MHTSCAISQYVSISYEGSATAILRGVEWRRIRAHYVRLEFVDDAIYAWYDQIAKVARSVSCSTSHNGCDLTKSISTSAVTTSW